jgi:hypothetical protein
MLIFVYTTGSASICVKNNVAWSSILPSRLTLFPSSNFSDCPRDIFASLLFAFHFSSHFSSTILSCTPASTVLSFPTSTILPTHTSPTILSCQLRNASRQCEPWAILGAGRRAWLTSLVKWTLSREEVVLWEDILLVFKNALHLRHVSRALPFLMKDEEVYVLFFFCVWFLRLREG